MKRLAISRIESATWLLIYGGLLLFGLGLSLQRGDADALGWTLVVLGLAASAIGFVLVWVRSRLRGEGDPPV